MPEPLPKSPECVDVVLRPALRKELAIVQAQEKGTSTPKAKEAMTLSGKSKISGDAKPTSVRRLGDASRPAAAATTIAKLAQKAAS